jgi:hypothetical protein
MRIHRAWAAALLTSACRLAGPEGSPTELIDVNTDGASEQPTPVAGPEENGASDGLEEPLPSDGAEEPRATGGFEAGGAPDGSEEGGATPEPAMPPEADAPMATCTAPAGLICEPVSGTGCLPLMQCVVDPNASVAAAYCLFSNAPLAMGCTQDPLGTSCPPRHTCIAGECREYCYCDSDCQSGTACTDPSGQGGSDAFKLCARSAP